MLLIGYLNNGGAENSVVKLANELSKDHLVYIVVANGKEKDYLPNCKVIEIPELKNMLTKIIGFIRVKKLKKKLHIDTSISYTTVFNFLNVTTKYHDKVIISIRNYLTLKEQNLLYKLLHKYSLIKSDLVVCCSKGVYYDQANHYHANKNKLKVIENFNNLDLIKKQSKVSLGDDNFIMTIARLTKHKGLMELIDGFKVFTKKNHGTKLLIFGRGPLKEELEKIIKHEQLENNIFLMGFEKNIYKYLFKAKCFILTSHYEGFSNSIIEALACKTPVIAYNSPGGNKEILTDSSYGSLKKAKKYYGILLNDLDPVNISNAIEEIINNNDYYKKKSYERSKKYTSEKIMRKWYDIL